MAGKLSVFIVLCLAVTVYSAPQFNQGASQFNQPRQQPFNQQSQFNQQRSFQAQPQAQSQFVQQPAQQAQPQSRFLVTEEKFHQEPNLEYNFE